jgi:hypothetical protein
VSTTLYPTFPGIDVRIRRTKVYDTEIQEAASGVELRPSIKATPRFRYELTYNFLRTAAGTQEAQALEAHFDAHGGRRESFLFDDPLDGVRRATRFDQDELEFEQIIPGLWTCTVELITVL